MTIVSPPPKRPTPKLGDKTLSSASPAWTAILKTVWRPIFVVAIVLHAVVLFVPFGRKKPEPLPTPSPIEKDVKIDRISLAKKAPAPKPKARPKPSARPRTNVQPVIRPRPNPAPRQPPPPPQADSNPDDLPYEDPNPSGKPISSTGGSPGPSSGSGDPGGSDPCDWASLIASYPPPEYSSQPTADEFRNPDFYYDGATPKSIVADIVIIPRTVGDVSSGTQEQYDFYRIKDDLKKACASKGVGLETVKEANDDELYRVKGSSAYISLAKPFKPTAAVTFLVVWSGDPTAFFP